MNMDVFQPGQRAELEAVVTKEMTTNQTGRPDGDVLSTPAMLELMENSCQEVINPQLSEEYASVGFAVDRLRHIAPTAIGQRVKVKSVLTNVDRNRLTFDVEAFEGDKKIGVAVHKRAVISRDPGAG